MVYVVAEAHDDAVAHGTDDELRGVAAEVGEEGEGEVEGGEAKETDPLSIFSTE